MEFKGSIALVTGASKGIGKAIAAALVEKGCTVIITARNADVLKETATAIGAVPFVADIADEAQVRDLFSWIVKQYGRLDILVNNAGLMKGSGPIWEAKMEDFEYVYRINVFGAAMAAKYASTIFKEQKSGNIINIASTASLKGYQTGSIYASSKFALRGMTQCWQDELRKYNVRVMLINPTAVPTAFGTADGVEKPLENNKVAPMDIAHAVVSALEMNERAFITELTVWATNPW
jgi:3-oxoacyl-[acyl-carrier protein] reductase